MPDTKRTLADIARDLQTLRQGSMPTGDKAPVAKAPIVDPDPVEEARIQRQIRRNKGQMRDVNLPVDAKSALMEKLRGGQ